MSLTIGLVGKPSSGKSTFFKAATMLDVKISPVPFTTIKPNLGTAYITIDCVEKEFGVKCNPKSGHCKNGKRFVPVKLVDVAGLVPGAHEGRGLGNKFLDEIRQSSVLIHILDASGTTDEEGNPTSNHDPEKDAVFLEDEIDFWFSSVIQKALPKVSKVKAKSEIVSALYEQLSGLEISKAHIENALEKFPDPSLIYFVKYLRKISKQIVIAANKIDMKSAQENFEKMKNKFEKIIPTSADAEIVLKKAAEKRMISYEEENNFTINSVVPENQKKILDLIQKQVVEKYGSTGVQKCLNTAVFDVLNYIAVYPVADANKLCDKDKNILPDVFLVPKGTTVKEFAFKVHTSMGEKFIAGIDARTKRRLAADYELKNNDVVEITFGK